MTEALTHTKRSTFKECRYRYYLRHELHLEPVAQKPGRRRGTAFGNAIFAARVGDPAAAIVAAVAASYSEVLEAAGSTEQVAELELEMVKVSVMALEYVQVYGTEERREVVFDLPLVNPTTGRTSRSFTRAGKVDGMVPLGGNTARLIEDKLYQSIDRAMVESLPLDEQMFEYVDALAQRGWDAEVEYRITRYPGVNPAKAKTFKTKPDVPAESPDEFASRLAADVRSRPEFYFVSQRLLFDQEMLVKYRQERWDTAKDLLETRRNGRWYRSTSRCKDYGGCVFLPHCRGHDPDLDLYRAVVDNPELATG